MNLKEWGQMDRQLKVNTEAEQANKEKDLATEKKTKHFFKMKSFDQLARRKAQGWEEIFKDAELITECRRKKELRKLWSFILFVFIGCIYMRC